MALSKVSGHVDSEFAAYLRTILDVWARPGINNPDDAATATQPGTQPARRGTRQNQRAEAGAPAPNLRCRTACEPEERPFPRDFGELADLADTLPATDQA